MSSSQKTINLLITFYLWLAVLRQVAGFPDAASQRSRNWRDGPRPIANFTDLFTSYDRGELYKIWDSRVLSKPNFTLEPGIEWLNRSTKHRSTTTRRRGMQAGARVKNRNREFKPQCCVRQCLIIEQEDWWTESQLQVPSWIQRSTPNRPDWYVAQGQCK